MGAEEREQGMNLEEKIRAYWEDPNSRSLIDENLRRLEEGVVLRHLKPDQTLLDVGCGDGVSTLRYASAVRSCLGVERSGRLLTAARERLAGSPLRNTRFEGGDILRLQVNREAFDVVVSQRMLINLTSWELQQEGIAQMRAALRPGGLLILIENTDEGHDALNACRAAVNLKPIAKHWHNLYFRRAAFLDHMARGFEPVEERTFSLYYLLTRVYANCFASFKGFGAQAVKDPVFGKIDASARALQEGLEGRVRIGPAPVIGPIQGFVFRRR